MLGVEEERAARDAMAAGVQAASAAMAAGAEAAFQAGSVKRKRAEESLEEQKQGLTLVHISAQLELNLCST